MIENLLVVHHIGGRNGSRSFPLLPAFEKDIINVIYDADESCLTEIQERWEIEQSKTIVLPYCLSSHDGVCSFHINSDPYTSSIYPLNPRYSEFYSTGFDSTLKHGVDNVLGNSFRSVRKVQLSMTTLDAVVIDRKIVPGPDYLSIDTQGSELDILKGASRLLDTTILAVQTEIELHPLYEGQPLFGEICQFLEKHNFDLVNVELFSKFLPMRGKQGFRGEGYVAHGEAFFLKRSEAVTDSTMLNKLAFIATIYGQFEFAQKCFQSNYFHVESQAQANTAVPKPQYLYFISRLARAVEMLPERSLPLLFILNNAENAVRENTSSFQASIIKLYLKKISPLITLVRFSRSILQWLKAAISRIDEYKLSIMISICWWLKHSGSTVEELFVEYKMEDQFRLAMRNRILDTRGLPSVNF